MSTEPTAAASPSAEETSPVTEAVPPPTLAPTVPPPVPRVPGATPEAPDAPPPPPLTLAEKGEKGARGVLLTWARALENRQFDVAWAQFLNKPASRQAFVRWWQRYRTLTVTVPTGEMDAGAGSLYYTAPVTITGTTRTGEPFRLEGEAVLRRVNDVDGATPQQLRWHMASADLKNVPVR